MIRYALVVTGFGLALLAPPRPHTAGAADPDRKPGVFEGLAGSLRGLASSRPREYSPNEFVTNWVVRDPNKPPEVPVIFGPEEERGPGVLLHRSQGVIQFRRDLPPPEVERLLKIVLPNEYFFQPVDAAPRLGTVTVRLMDTAPRPVLELKPEVLDRLTEDQRKELRDVKAVQAALAKVRQQPWAEVAVQDLLIGVAIVPAKSDGKALAPDNQFLIWDWDPKAKRDGNWGLKRMNFPSAWNFNDAIRRRGGRIPAPGEVEVGIIDVGFGNHDDLPHYCSPWFAHSPITDMGRADHGNHVSGIVSASWNTLGVDGCAPYSTVTVCTVADLSFKRGEKSRWMTAVLSQVLHTVENFIFNHPSVKVINLSLGYNWVANEGIDPNDPEVRRTVEYFGRLAWAAAQLAETQGKGILIVSAAGNDSAKLAQPADAQWSSPSIGRQLTPTASARRCETSSSWRPSTERAGGPRSRISMDAWRRRAMMS